MNEQVRAFLDKAKNEKLLSMGLVKEVKREYGPYGQEFSKYDKEAKQYYRETPIPIDISDDEFEKLLQYEKINVPRPKESAVVSKTPVKNTAEQILNVYISVILAIGIVVAAILIVAGFVSGYSVSWTAVLYGVIVLILSFLSWASMKVIINISNNLHEIKAKLK